MAAQDGQWKESFKEAVVAALADKPDNHTAVIEAIEVRKKGNPIHEYRVILRPGS
jgi:hypothetical protein